MFTLVTHTGGSFTKLLGTSKPTANRGTRGTILGFSDSSRKHLQRKMASINEQKAAAERWMLTLTYPNEYPHCGKTWKRHLDTFLKRLARRYALQAVVWKLEPQKRGAPHFHLLVLADSELEKSWVSRSWFEVVGSGDIKHLKAGTRTERINSWRGVLSYASKYIGKVVEQTLDAYWKSAGRWWGVRGDLPIEPVVTELNLREGALLRRVMMRYVERRMGRRIRLRGFKGIAAFLRCDTSLTLAAWAVRESRTRIGSPHAVAWQRPRRGPTVDMVTLPATIAS